MVFILIVLGVFLIIKVLIAYQSNPQDSNGARVSRTFNPKQDEKKRKSHGFVITNKKVKKNDIVGTYYALNEDSSYAGPFEGYAICYENPFDDYAVAIFNSEKIRLGYIPKRDRWVHNSIKHYYNGKAYCFGYLGYVKDIAKPYWYGSVFIAIGISEYEIDSLKRFYTAYRENIILREKPNKDSSDYELIIDNYIKANSIKASSKRFEDLEIVFERRYLVSYVVSLAKEKKHHKIDSLSKYQSLIEELTTFQKSIIQKNIQKLNKEQNSIDKKDVKKVNTKIKSNHEWESKTLLWSKTERSGYTYSIKKDAWWKYKNT